MVKTKNKKKESFFKGWKAAPLKGSFMMFSILGFIISTYLVYTRNKSYGLAFMIIFVLMFIASLISMTKAPITKDGY